MFRVEFTVHMRCRTGTTSFCREEQLPFVPFPGLDVLDDALGEFKLEHVAWHSGSQMFLCQGRVECNYWDFRTACPAMAKAGWAEVEDVRQLD